MKIIIPGDATKLKKIKRFTCKECGCVFEADKTEYRSESQYNEEYYACKCPICGQWAYTS